MIIDVKQKLREFLKKQTVAVIATVSLEGKPHASAVHYVADEQFNFYFITRKQTRKYDDLKKNKKIALVIGCENKPESLQCEGVAEELSGEDFENEIKERPLYHYLVHELYADTYGVPKSKVFNHLKGIDFVMFKITPDWLRWLLIDPKNKDEIYHQIIG